ncbi:hypothetical protein AB0I81_32115 [Nonomuraea sp. NPDC050404]|uniref:hypothetical protein n=1 Tax=Nonomuraea sp. NPDC050404 TaxID=3155783 RepID=UPI0033E56433
MDTVALHLSVAMPASPDPRHLSLLMLTVLIGLTVTAIRKLFRRTQLVMVVSGTSVMLVILTVLLLAYMITYGGA